MGGRSHASGSVVIEATRSRAHRWIGLGWFPLTWVDVDEMQGSESGIVEFEEDSPQFRFGGVFCVVCDEPYAPDNPWCRGLPPSRPNDHHYVSIANFLMTDEEARAWDEDRLEEIPRPKTLVMACWFCGEAADDPMSDCPERAFWIERDWQGSWSEAEILWRQPDGGSSDDAPSTTPEDPQTSG